MQKRHGLKDYFYGRDLCIQIKTSKELNQRRDTSNVSYFQYCLLHITENDLSVYWKTDLHPLYTSLEVSLHLY